MHVASPATVAALMAKKADPPPTPDGKIVVRTIWGQTHEYLYADMAPNNGWRPAQHYLSISVANGRVNWPWASIAFFETHHNSAEYAHAVTAWRERNLVGEN